MSRRVRVVSALAAAGVLLAATGWAFLAYTDPDRVYDFAALLQMCGIPAGRGLR